MPHPALSQVSRRGSARAPARLAAGLAVSAVVLSSACAAMAAAPEAALPPQERPSPVRSGLAMEPPQHQEDAALQAAVASSARTDADRARDAWRRPFESLTFWGLRPGLTVVEIEPGRGGWWSAILQPYLVQTGGRYVAVNRPLESMEVGDGEADLILVARAFHNWARAGRTEAYLAVFFRALKPGGVLAIEQHRAQEGLNVAETAPTGYVSESYVIRAALAAGFVLDGRSELNANPADDRDHAFGVWTLPPTRRSEGDGRVLTAEERAAYDAIGESDRMTLRFRKPE